MISLKLKAKIIWVILFKNTEKIILLIAILYQENGCKL